jgi:uncharacterized protein (TIGR02588 family)
MNRIAKHPLEWVIFSVSLLVVVSTVGYLAWDALRGARGPAALRIELGRPEPSAGAWAVPVAVRNLGHETAGAIRVEVTLELPGSEPERAELEVLYVPRQSQREGWVTFRQDPSRGRLSARALGYERP